MWREGCASEGAPSQLVETELRRAMPPSSRVSGSVAQNGDTLLSAPFLGISIVARSRVNAARMSKVIAET